jgi:hypothetical protein
VMQCMHCILPYSQPASHTSSQPFFEGILFYRNSLLRRNT